MKLIHGYPEVKFLELTVKELKETEEAIKKIESKSRWTSDCLQVWENCMKDKIRLKKDLEQIGLEQYCIPVKSADNRVLLMKYCNNRLSYGIGIENEITVYYLCASPTLEAVVLNVISQHETSLDMQEAFYQQRNN